MAKRYLWTIDELVDLFHPDYVGVNNPKTRDIPTSGSTKVARFTVENDVDGLFLYVDIIE